jgi:ribosomal protein S18 acetylase RimI-like enzyme
MSSFRIREAKSVDRDAIGDLWRELMLYHRSLDARFTIAPDGEQKYVRHALDMMRSRNATVLVAEDLTSGEIVGYLMAELQSRPAIALPGLYGFISDICVQEAWRHQGIGRALFEEITRWFVARNAQAIELYIAEENPDSAAFWHAMGLTPFLKLLHVDLK